MIQSVALAVVTAAGAYLVGLGLACLVAPARAGRFLLAFASSARWHCVELSVRLVVGVALVLAAPRLLASSVLSIAGWVLLATTSALLALPWRWHRRIARETVPRVLSALPALGLGSIALGAAVLCAVFGSAPH